MRPYTIIFGVILFFSGMFVGLVLQGTSPPPVESRVSIREVTERVENNVREDLPPEWNLRTLPTDGRQSDPEQLPNFTDIAEQTIAAVTNISSRQVMNERRSLFSDDPFFRYFFGDSKGIYGYRERPNLGSGVVVSKDGYILTNAHVVGSRTAGVTVRLADNREVTAELIGRDESTDIALLWIDVNGLPTVPWGDSSALRIAEWVLAIGNPFQLNQTVTLGIVSAVGRDNLGVARYEDFIQTDAAINPGNSGGALVNRRGELVGINTAIFSESGGSQGIGFAVPSNLAKRVMEDLINHGAVRRGSFGYVDVRTLTPQLARELEAPGKKGVIIWRIHQASSAAMAGLEPGDIIVSFNGESVEDAAVYARLLSDSKIGSKVRVEILRNGETMIFHVGVFEARKS